VKLAADAPSVTLLMTRLLIEYAVVCGLRTHVRVTE
jgi:hypothetical protein